MFQNVNTQLCGINHLSGMELPFLTIPLIFMCIWIWSRKHPNAQVYTYIYTYIYSYIYNMFSRAIYIYIHTHTHTHTHTHSHTHIYSSCAHSCLACDRAEVLALVIALAFPCARSLSLSHTHTLDECNRLFNIASAHLLSFSLSLSFPRSLVLTCSHSLFLSHSLSPSLSHTPTR